MLSGPDDFDVRYEGGKLGSPSSFREATVADDGLTLNPMRRAADENKRSGVTRSVAHVTVSVDSPGDNDSDKSSMKSESFGTSESSKPLDDSVDGGSPSIKILDKPEPTTK